MSTVESPWATVFGSALRGAPAVLRGPSATTLRVADWTRDADPSDRALLEHCVGPTVDLGCGPGRMSQHLARRGQVVLGIDLVPEAVLQTRERGAAALVRDLFRPLPAEGRWETALLADGNIGIGGDPVALLARVAELLAPAGRVVADLAGPGVALVTRWLRLETVAGCSRPFPWTVVGVDQVGWVANAAGFDVVALHVVAAGAGRPERAERAERADRTERWFAVLRRRP